MLRRADAAAEVMEHLCSHSAHGYSQPNRAGIGTGGGVGEHITLSDGEMVGISSGDRDCSSAAIECYEALGIDCGGAYYTGDMVAKMVASGNFKKLPASTWRNPERGDLLVATGKHVAMALGGGNLGEALRSEHHSTHGTPGDQDGGEILVRQLYDDGWDAVLRYCGPELEDDLTDEQAKQLKFIYEHMNWNDKTHFSDLGNLVIQMPVTYGSGDAKTTAPLGDRLAYIDAHTHTVDNRLKALEDKIDALGVLLSK